MLVLVGRELSLFLHVDAGAVPLKQRAGFVALEVRRAAPFADPEHDVIWFGSHAAVWYWSRSRAHALLGEPARRVRTRAESAYRGESVDGNAVELLALAVPDADGSPFVAGYDARLWRDGYIAASRWWPQEPSTADWQAFLRGGGMDPARPAPSPTDTILREQPLNGGFQPQALTGQLRTQLPRLASAAGALVLGMLGWQLAGVLGVSSEINEVEQQTVPLEQRLETIIDARARADAAAATIDELLALRPASSQTRLLAEVARITPGTTWEIMAWHQPGPDMLEVTFIGASADTAAMVSAWEQSPLLQEVSPATGSRMDELVLVARLTSLAEQTATDDSTGANSPVEQAP